MTTARHDTFYPKGDGDVWKYEADDWDSFSGRLFFLDIGVSAPACGFNFSTATERRTNLMLIPGVNGSAVPFDDTSLTGWFLTVADLNHDEGAGTADQPDLHIPAGTWELELGWETENADLTSDAWDLDPYIVSIPDSGATAVRDYHVVLGNHSFNPTGLPDTHTYSVEVFNPTVIPAGETFGLLLLLSGQGTGIIGNSIEFFHERSGLGNSPFNFELRLPGVPYFVWDRDTSNDAGAPSAATPTRVFTGSRATEQTVPPPTEDITRVFTGSRFTADDVPVPDKTVIRSADHPRQTYDTVEPPADWAERVVAFNRIGVEGVDPLGETIIRLVSTTRFALDSAPAVVDTAARLVTYGRVVRYQFQPGDEPLLDPSKAIRGVVRDNVGVAYLGEATVFLVRADLNVAVQTTTSSPTTGGYEFPRNSYDANRYYVVAFAEEHEGAEVPLQAITERVLTAE